MATPQTPVSLLLLVAFLLLPMASVMAQVEEPVAEPTAATQPVAESTTEEAMPPGPLGTPESVEDDDIVLGDDDTPPDAMLDPRYVDDPEVHPLQPDYSNQILMIAGLYATTLDWSWGVARNGQEAKGFRLGAMWALAPLYDGVFHYEYSEVRAAGARTSYGYGWDFDLLFIPHLFMVMARDPSIMHQRAGFILRPPSLRIGGYAGSHLGEHIAGFRLGVTWAAPFLVPFEAKPKGDMPALSIVPLRVEAYHTFDGDGLWDLRASMSAHLFLSALAVRAEFRFLSGSGGDETIGSVHVTTDPLLLIAGLIVLLSD